MANKLIGTGASTRKDVNKAASEAVRQALGRLRGAKVTFGFVFAGPGHNLAVATSEVQRMTECPDIVGSSTAGELTERGRLDDGLVVMLVSSGDTHHRIDFARGIKTNHRLIAEQFTKSASEVRKEARLTGRRNLTTVLLTDGLAGTGEDLVTELFQQSMSIGQIVGGAAGDAGQFKQTLVAGGRDCAGDAATSLHVCDAKPWGVGVEHGLRPTTRPMRVTRSHGGVLHTIEGQPAFDVYKKHASDRGITLTRETAGPYMIENQLGVHFFSSLSRARAPLAVAEDGSLTCAAPVPEGSFVSILDGEPNSMLAAAKSAAQEARRKLGDAQPAGVLLFDCVCRGMILKREFGKEIEAVRSEFGEVPIAGFLTYGEIAHYAGRFDGWHNATLVVAAIPA